MSNTTTAPGVAEGVVPAEPQTLVTDEQQAILVERYPDAYAFCVGVAIRVARDQTTCRALLLGLPVDPVLLDADELRHAKQKRLVRLATPLECAGLDQLSDAA